MNISQIGGDATFNYGKFHLNTRLHFQNALTNKNLLPMPSFIGRANFFYQTQAFKKAAEIQGDLKYIISLNLIQENISRFLMNIFFQALIHSQLEDSLLLTYTLI